MGSHQEICVRGVEARQCCSIWCSSKIKPLKEHQRKGPLWQSRQSGNRDRDVRESSKCFEEQSIPTRALIVFLSLHVVRKKSTSRQSSLANSSRPRRAACVGPTFANLFKTGVLLHNKVRLCPRDCAAVV